MTTSGWVYILVVFTVLCALIYYPVYIRMLNSSIKVNRALLLLVPVDVVDSVQVGVECWTVGLSTPASLSQPPPPEATLAYFWVPLLCRVSWRCSR